MLAFTSRRLVFTISIVVDHTRHVRKPCSTANSRGAHTVALRLRAFGRLGGIGMPEKETLRRARKAKRSGKAPSTQAGEFVREEIHHVREGKHGARSTKQAIAIGLSKARRSGVKLPAPRAGSSAATKRSAAAATRAGRRGRKRTSPRRARAVKQALKRESRSAASRKNLSRQAKTAARRRSAADRSSSARRASRTKGPQVRRSAARRAARTRQRRRRASA
jgi:hypothetical protein